MNFAVNRKHSRSTARQCQNAIPLRCPRGNWKYNVHQISLPVILLRRNPWEGHEHENHRDWSTNIQRSTKHKIRDFDNVHEIFFMLLNVLTQIRISVEPEKRHIFYRLGSVNFCHRKGKFTRDKNLNFCFLSILITALSSKDTLYRDMVG